jgi:FkbM family methyltransferase
VTDYSQGGEQAAILEWAVAQPTPGSFLDLGAFDGEQYSNTAALAEQGWPGILVEAAPDAVSACATRYASRSDVLIVQGAFSTNGKPVTTIHWTPGEMYSSLRRDQAERASKPVPIAVPRVDLAWLAEQLAELPNPLFCSIDLEGTSLEALDWLLENADPACICVEANIPGDRIDVRARLAGWREMKLPNHGNLLLARPG